MALKETSTCVSLCRRPEPRRQARERPGRAAARRAYRSRVGAPAGGCWRDGARASSSAPPAGSVAQLQRGCQRPPRAVAGRTNRHAADAVVRQVHPVRPGPQRSPWKRSEGWGWVTGARWEAAARDRPRRNARQLLVRLGDRPAAPVPPGSGRPHPRPHAMPTTAFTRQKPRSQRANPGRSGSLESAWRRWPGIALCCHLAQRPPHPVPPGAAAVRVAGALLLLLDLRLRAGRAAELCTVSVHWLQRVTHHAAAARNAGSFRSAPPSPCPLPGRCVSAAAACTVRVCAPRRRRCWRPSTAGCTPDCRRWSPLARAPSA